MIFRNMSAKFPLAVEIEINSHCNMACDYCPNSVDSRVEKGHMEESLFLRILEQLKSINYTGRISYHFYNEPTLSPNLEKFTLLTKEYLPECHIVLYTNGTFLDQAKIENLFASGVDRFKITAHQGAKLTKFENALKELDFKFLKSIQFKKHQDLFLTNRGGAISSGLASLRKPTLKTPCFIPSCGLVITLKGNVVPCYEDFYQKHVMGNIQEQSLSEIWQSQKYSEFRNTLKFGNRELLEVCNQCNNNCIIT